MPREYKLLGADPEFCLIDEHGTIVTASRALSMNMRAKFGPDGGGECAEIRPTPADTPRGLAASIRRTLARGYERYGYSMVAGTGSDLGYPTGGHLHLQLEPENVDPHVLDVYIGLPLAALEPEVGRSWRRKMYGRWGDIRSQNWGLEYRTPSSWLVSPATTLFASALAWLVTLHHDELSWKSHEIILPLWNRGQAEFVNKAYLALSHLTTLSNYPKVAELLEPFNFFVDVLGTWCEERRLEDTWGLRVDIQKPLYTEREERAMERPPDDDGVDTNIIWNSDLRMDRIMHLCGPVASGLREKVWAVGLRHDRGDDVLLSPALYERGELRILLAKFLKKKKVDVQVKLWDGYPHKNGEFVIGLPLNHRKDSPLEMAVLVRLAALHSFNRIMQEKKKVVY